MKQLLVYATAFVLTLGGMASLESDNPANVPAGNETVSDAPTNESANQIGNLTYEHFE